MQTDTLIKNHVMRNIMLRIGAILLLTAGTILVTSEPSMAVSCTWTSCSGKDPQGQGCSTGATTKAIYSTADTTIEVRYSTACHALWARARQTGPDPTCAFFVNIYQDRLSGGNWYPSAQQRLVAPHSLNCQGEQGWTYMVTDYSGQTDRYHACGTWTTSPVIVPPASAYTTCTGYFI
jgi:hypothetical protein